MDELREMTIEEVRRTQIAILDGIDAFCAQNGIRYFITAGTLIGALRHKGYIPWDDDIDLVMLRPDYDKMVRSFNEGRSDRLRLLCHENTARFPYAFAKVSDEGTLFIEDESKKHLAPVGVNVDIFPLDSVTDDYEDAVRLMRRTKKYTRIVELKNVVRTKKRSPLKTAALAVMQAGAGLFSYRWCFRKIEKIARTYEGNTDSKYIANAVIHAKEEREILERAWFADTVDLPFEDKQYKAPVGYDAYMRRLFGDYMTPPPKDKQITHHSFKAYRKENDK